MKHISRKIALVGILALVLLVGMTPLGVSAQQPGSPTYIRVSGTGTAYASPDIAYVSLGVEVLNEDISAAVNEANERVNAVMSALEAGGVAEGDIRTENFYIYRDTFYPPEGGMPQPGAFRVNNYLVVTVRDSALVPTVISAALEAGATAVNNVSFNVADTEGLESEARALAVADARKVAEELAGLLGVSVGDVTAVSEYSVPASPYFSGGYGGGGGGGGGIAPPPVQGGSLAVSITVEVTFDLAR